MQEKMLFISAVFSIIGLLACWLFQPPQEYRRVSLEELKKDCYGTVSFSARVSHVFVSSKGNKIALLKQNDSVVMMLANDFPSLKKGELVMIDGRASNYKSSCWVFPVKVEKTWML